MLERLSYGIGIQVRTTGRHKGELTGRHKGATAPTGRGNLDLFQTFHLKPALDNLTRIMLRIQRRRTIQDGEGGIGEVGNVLLYLPTNKLLWSY
ncbi:hypothetical protein CEXT_67911 [Caerostris extrusa]|uniref:Uncharacterized protein n=1 Tax=Caerostris extrusa TaxID=172846 RepID=A0AAV4VSZ0_CAEEX|nr:hypothetical protein CEXT_67911 [Caerostris extrusa]